MNVMSEIAREHARVEQQRNVLDKVGAYRVALMLELEDPDATPEMVATCAKSLKKYIELARSIIPDCAPSVFIEVDDNEDGEPLEDIRL